MFKGLSFEELTTMESDIDQGFHNRQTEEELVSNMMKIIYGDDVIEYIS